MDHFLRGRVTIEVHGAGIGIVDFGQFPGFEQADDVQNPVDQIERLEASNRHRDAVFGGQRRVFVIAHHGADVSGQQKALNAVGG